MPLETGLVIVLFVTVGASALGVGLHSQVHSVHVTLETGTVKERLLALFTNVSPPLATGDLSPTPLEWYYCTMALTLIERPSAPNSVGVMALGLDVLNVLNIWVWRVWYAWHVLDDIALIEERFLLWNNWPEAVIHIGQYKSGCTLTLTIQSVQSHSFVFFKT